MAITESIVERISDEERLSAEETAKEINELLDAIKNDEIDLARNFARLGTTLIKIRAKKFWLLWGFSNFSQYIESIRERVGKGRTQLYSCVSVAEKLLPFVTETELSEIGITKSGELARAVRNGSPITKELIAHARDPKTTIESLRAELFENKVNPSEPRGIYFDFGGAYLSSDEKAEIMRAFDVACRVDPVIDQALPEHARRKEVFLRWAREFLATYEALVNKGEA